MDIDTATANQTQKQRRAAGQALSQLLGKDRLHVRAADREALTYVHLVGTAWELHGPAGACVCCHGGDPARGRRAVVDRG